MAQWIGLLGIIPLVTGFLGICPAYLALGIRIEPKLPRKPEFSRAC